MQLVVDSAGRGRIRKCSGDFPARTLFVLTVWYTCTGGGLGVGWSAALPTGTARSGGTEVSAGCDPQQRVPPPTPPAPLSAARVPGQRTAHSDERGLSLVVLAPRVDDNVLLISMSFFTLMFFPF